MTDVPIFGEKNVGINYVERHGAYIIIQNQEEQIVLVQAPNGAYFLPGGEIESSETQVEAIHREVKEELGFEVEIDSYLGQADDYFYSRHRDTHFHNPAYFFSAKKWQQACVPLEDFNVIEWFAIEEAVEKLKRGSHKWAVKVWLSNH
ncbi:NUDIX hydrolase [uncultured Vagococcus sp.]|uniref:NUDIX hydrolase n=1 Tax=uncultured Vagococcus sp. TaxID=189676 RepID=UPI0028D2FEC0|nr:NUDIX hydrolase [uncultured Vagococcus sp.]